MIIEFLFVFVLSVFLFFGMLDYWVVLTKHQYAEHLMHRYLQRMQVEGWLSSADEAALMDAFDSFGCPVESIEARRESQGQERILRNPEDLDASTVRLRITCRPTPSPLMVGRLIGGKTGRGMTITVGGAMLSERVNP